MQVDFPTWSGVCTSILDCSQPMNSAHHAHGGHVLHFWLGMSSPALPAAPLVQNGNFTSSERSVWDAPKTGKGTSQCLSVFSFSSCSCLHRVGAEEGPRRLPQHAAYTSGQAGGGRPEPAGAPGYLLQTSWVGCVLFCDSPAHPHFFPHAYTLE